MRRGRQSSPFPVDVSRETWWRLETYVELLLKWQQRINLIGPATAEHVWTRHVADGLQLLPLVQPRVRTAIDLGSGGGIPGLVLAIALIDRQPATVHLVESIGKKAAFLRHAIQATEAPAVVHNCRIESLAALVPYADLVTARALAPLPRLIGLASPWLGSGAYGLFHKGRGVDKELIELATSWRISYTVHPSLVDPTGCIVEVRGVEHVPG